MWHYKKASRVQSIIVFCLAILGGLWLSIMTKSLSYNWALLLPVLLMIGCKKAAYIAIPSLVISGVIVGLVRGGSYSKEVHKYDLLSGEKATLIVTSQEHATYNDKKQLTFRADNVYSEKLGDLVGTIKVSGFGEVDIARGDVLSATGRLFKTRGSNVASMYYAQINTLGTTNSILDGAKNSFVTSIRDYLPEPQASLAAGIVIGEKTDLPSNITDNFRTTSLTHIIVASGYNLTIIVGVCRTLFKKRSKFQTLVAALVVQILFIGITGLSASMIRAAIVSTLSLLAWYYGRNLKPLLIIVFTAAITAYIKPLYIWSDIGWWLSYAAFFGVLVVSPLVVKTLFLNTKPKMFTNIIIETVSAQLMTAPIIAFSFGTFSVVGILVNLLIVPLIPLLMLLVVSLVLLSFVWTFGASWFAIVVAWALRYIVDMASVTANLSFAQINKSLSAFALTFIYLAIITCLGLLYRRASRKTEVLVQ